MASPHPPASRPQPPSRQTRRRQAQQVGLGEPAAAAAESESSSGPSGGNLVGDDGQGEAEEAHGQGDRGEDRRGDDQPRRGQGRAEGPARAGEGRPRQDGVPALQGDGPRRQVDADPPRGAPPQAPLRPGQDQQPARLHRRRARRGGRRLHLQAQARHPRQPQEDGR